MTLYEVTGSFSVAGHVLVDAESPDAAREKAAAGDWLEHHLWQVHNPSALVFEATGEVDAIREARAA